MADERIDIEINDKIDGNIPKKLRDIATGADKGEASVKKLKAALAEINSTPARRLKDASDSVTSSLNRELEAQNRLSAATSKASLADAKAATQKQRLATEIERTAAAQARAVTAATNAERAALALAAAQARQATSGADLASRADRLRASLDPLYAAQMRFNNELHEAETLFNRGAISANTFGEAVDRAGMKMRMAGETAPQLDAGLNNLNKTGKGLGATNANILAQFNDLGVQFSMAAASSKPLQGVFMALIQQGSQLAYIASVTEGGWKGIAGQAGMLLLKLAPLIVAIGAAYLVIKDFNSELSKTAGLDKYAKTLGLTAAELKKLEDQHVTITDTLKATWTVLSEDMAKAMGTSTKEINKFFSDMYKTILNVIKATFLAIYSGSIALVKTIAAIVGNIGKMFYNAGIAAKNLFLIGIEGLVNGTIEGINKIGDAINWLSGAAGMGDVVGKLDKVSLGVKGVGDGMLALTKVDFMGDFVDAIKDGEDKINRIQTEAEKNARDRLKKDADAMIADRTPKAGPKGKEDHTAENRAQALKLVNMELDNELNRMQMLKPEREFQQRMDQIDEQLARKKITINAEERKSIEDKVRAIQNYAFVQAESDRIYEEAVGPLRTMNAAVTAATDLYDKGAITLARYDQELQKATRSYDQATDPLFSMNEAVDAALKTTHLYGVELEKANYLEQVRQQLLAQGQGLYDAKTGKLREEVALLVAKNDALRQEQYIQSQVAAVVDPMQQDALFLSNKENFYAEIDRMRQTDKLSEEQAERAKAAIRAKYNEINLRGASSFFGELASLSSSGNKKIAMIGKAAAIAQATIDGFVAVQKALASAPPPWNIALAAAIAVKTGVQVAGIMSTNVGSFQDGGQFTVDGKAGVDRNNINMNVSRGERVTVETPAQQRASDGGSNNGQSPVLRAKIVNIIDPREALAAFDTEEGEQLLVNMIERKQSAIKTVLG